MDDSRKDTRAERKSRLVKMLKRALASAFGIILAISAVLQAVEFFTEVVQRLVG